MTSLSFVHPRLPLTLTLWLAAALGCPTVAIYTDSSPALTGVVAADASRVRNLGDAGRVPEPAAVKQVLMDLGLMA